MAIKVINRTTTQRAILIGFAWVSAPGILIFLASIAALVLLMRYATGASLTLGLLIAAVVLFLVLPLAAAWLWWALTIPKWRIWALRRHGDWPTLEREAIAAQLIWDDNTRMGRLFSRTELWSAADRKTFAAMKRPSQQTPPRNPT